jgi:hypothetical protein
MMNLYIYQYDLSLSVPFNIMVSISSNESTYHLVVSQFAMERSTIFKNGKPSISMGHLYHGKLLVITRGYLPTETTVDVGDWTTNYWV